jgi:hypothetical protein
MQADAQGGESPRALYGVLCGVSTDHQACRREDPLPMRSLDSLVHGKRKTEIVGGDDELSALTHKVPR